MGLLEYRLSEILCYFISSLLGSYKFSQLLNMLKWDTSKSYRILFYMLAECQKASTPFRIVL